MAFKYELGSKARDKVTGYEGLIQSRTEWLYGCVRYGLQAQGLKDGKPYEAIGVDEDAIEIIESAEPHTMRETGGPTREPPRARDVARR